MCLRSMLMDVESFRVVVVHFFVRPKKRTKKRAPITKARAFIPTAHVRTQRREGYCYSISRSASLAKSRIKALPAHTAAL